MTRDPVASFVARAWSLGFDLCCLLLWRNIEVRQQHRPDQVLVHNASTKELGVVQPEEESDLDKVVKGNVLDKEQGDGLDDSERPEDDPVGEPLCAPGGISSIDGLEGHVSGVDKAGQIRHELGTAH